MRQDTSSRRAPPATKARRITDAILSDIGAGRLRSGDRIGSERAMAAQFEVSVGTVQRVLQALENRGVIERQHGRGSFVRGLGASVDSRYLRFQDEKGVPLATRWHILKHSPEQATERLAAFFGSRARLVRIDRSVDVGGRFTLLSRFFLRRSDFDALFRDDGPRDDSNLRELISQRLALPTLRVEQHVGFEPMSAPIARALGARAGSPCFTLELRGFTVQERPIYLQRVYGAPFGKATLVVDTRSG